MKNHLIRIVGVTVIIAIMLMAVWPESEEEKKTKNMKNLESEIIRIELSEHYFDIPIRYLYGQAIEKYKQWPKAKKERVKVDALTLSVLLPDLRPYYLKDDEQWKLRERGNRVEITIKASKKTDGWYIFVRENIDKNTKKNLVTKEQNIYDLLHFSDSLGAKYFPVDDFRELVISCIYANKHEQKTLRRCLAKSNYCPGILFEYSYGADHLPHWREIEDGIKDMFNNFRNFTKSGSLNTED